MDARLRDLSSACKTKQRLTHVMAQLRQRALRSMQGKGPPMSNPRGLRALNETGKYASQWRHTRSVRRGISAFMIAMNGDVQSKVFRQILANGWHCSTNFVHVSVNASRKSWETRYKHKTVFQGVRPIIGLLYPGLICLLEHAIVVECRDADTELCHRV